MVKELTHLTGSVAMESEYFRVSAGKTIPLQSSPGHKAPSIPEAKALLEEWEARAAPILEKIKQALEWEISTVQSPMKLPLLEYRLTTWIVFEDDVPDFVRTEHYGRKGEPFGYAMRFDEQGVVVVVVFSTLPKKSSRTRLRDVLKKALEGLPSIPDVHKERVDAGKGGFGDVLGLGVGHKRCTPLLDFDTLLQKVSLKSCTG